MVEETSKEEGKWSPSATAVRKAMRFIRARGNVTPEKLVQWDETHGKALFNWNDRDAAEKFRVHQARLFLNSFRSVVDGMRVRAFINLPATEETGLTERTYVAVDDISRHAGMRQTVVNDIMKRIRGLTSELKMWKLSDAERLIVIATVQEELGIA